MTVVLWRVLVRSIASRSRVMGLGILGLVAAVLGAVVGASNPANRADAAWSVINDYGLSLLVPVVALMFASAALGDLAEDGTLVYLWLRPVPRGQLALAAFAAAVSVTIPIAVVPLVVGAAASGGGSRVVAAAAAGGTMAALAYSAAFCGLGLRVRRAVAWGLGYLLLWEGAVARVSHGAARISLSIAARSLAARVAGHHAPRNAVAWPSGLVLSLAVVVVALVLTTRSLDHGELP
jgi:ABC-2 type transport system permease protein